jgi:replicative DNA helicase
VSKHDWLLNKASELDDSERRDLIEKLLPDTSLNIDRYGMELASDYTEQAKERMANWGKLQGLSSGYAEVDRLTKGLVGGELVVIAGATSQGKTTVALNIANNVAGAGVPVLFVTLEMTKAEVTARLMKMNGGDNADYQQAASMLAYQKEDELNWKDIDGLIAKAKQELGVGLIVIDHLHYFSRELEHLSEDLGRITKELKKNAIRHDVPILLISHVRKKGNNEAKGKAPDIDDLRGSSYIAQDADIVLMVARAAEYPNKMVLRIDKNRNRGIDYTKSASGINGNVEVLNFDGVRLTSKEVPPWVTSRSTS